ncbi:MAG: hypothetical protein HY047_14985, partial [Acidobacteria bacterium]|nr:hypothetical protein [Acidobacteriota bacterium]
MKHDALDSAIDEAARQMTAGNTGAAFKARVLARLHERRSIWRSPWMRSPIAVAALIVVAVAVF